MNSSLPPRFYELDFSKFQELCSDLLSKDGRYSDSQVYGRNGQAQRGIDVLALLRDGSGVDVGQCKCWSDEPNASKIQKATDEFLQHLDFWKQQGLKRFILFAACPTDDTKVQDQILDEIRRFKTHGIAYEFWDARKLHRQLRPHPDVVWTHTQSEHWVQEICGPLAMPSDRAIHEGTRSVVRRQGLLLTELAGDRIKELEAVRELAAEGRGDEALRQVVALQARDSWTEMPDKIRAQALRIQASLTLSVSVDAASAKQLLNEAKATCPSANTRPIEAILLRESIGAQAAFDFLSSPRTIEEWNLRLELLLELGRPDEVLVEAATPPAGAKPTVETAHAKSLALLLNRQVAAARSEIQRALALKPNHFSLRHAGAIVDYASTVSSCFPAWGHLTWPVPPDWIMIKCDPASVAARQAAAVTFSQLAGLAPLCERESLLVWELACIANESDRQEEAQQRVQTLLHNSPSCIPAIIWASERHYEFDRSASIEALRQRVKSPQATREEVETLVTLLANSGDLAAGEAVLDQAQPQFAAWNALHSWRINKAQCLCTRGEVAEAKRLIETETDSHHRKILETVVLRSAIQTTKDAQAFAEHLKLQFETTSDDGLLLNCSEAKARVGDWGFIADHAEQLVSAVPTERALRLAVRATFNCKQYGVARELLEKHAAICSGGKLPANLRQLRAECLRHEGDVPKAVSELEKLAQENPEFERLAHLFTLQKAQGDLPASTLTARKFLELPDVPAGFLLQVAPIVRLTDPSLAAKLWQKAVDNVGNNPALKASAAFQSIQLGMESKAVDLLKALPAIAKSGSAPIRALNLEETIEFIRASNEDAKQFLELYFEGFIPVHLLPGRLGLTLGRLILGTAVENLVADSPRLRPPLMIRHGGRSSQAPIAVAPGQRVVFLDVTSVLLFHGLGLLELVERCFEIIVVSGNLMVALTAELNNLTHHQPSLLNSKRTVLAMFNAGKLQSRRANDNSPIRNDAGGDLMASPWSALLEWVRAREGLLVGHLPLMNNVSPLRRVNLSPDDLKLLCSERKIKMAMAAAGLIPAAEMPESPPEDPDGAPQSVPELRAGLLVYLDHGLAAQLALSSNALERLAAHCSVFIDESEVIEIRQEIESTERNDRLRAQIEQLLQHLSSGQSAGKYRTHLHPSPHAPDEHHAATTPQELCLCDTIHFGESVGAPVCCDDRFMQAYEHAGQAPIIGVTDLLHHFLSNCIISESTYFDLLFRLRTANARYLPPSTAEILYHLNRAPIREGCLEETPALRLLRRSIAAMLLDRDRLQEVSVNSKGERLLREMQFPVTCNRVVTDALLELWASNATLGVITARADWLWASLFVDMRIFRQCFKSHQGPESDLPSLAMTVGMIYTRGFHISASREDCKGVRSQFFEWLTSRVLTPTSQNTPCLIDVVAEKFLESLEMLNSGFDESCQENGEMSPEAMASRAVFGRVIMDLPEVVLRKLKLSPEQLERWGLRLQEPSVSVEGMQFTQREFWVAVSRVVKNGRATLISPDGKGKLRLARGPRPNALRVGRSGVLEIPILDLFHPEISRRRELLRAHPEWFDVDVDEREQAITRIVNERQPWNRVRILHTCRDNSLAEFYLQLSAGFVEKKRIDIDDLMPNSVNLLRHFIRLPASCVCVDSASPSDSVSRLLAEEGLQETISRLSCLPRSLPSAVLAEFDALEGSATDSLLESLARKCTSIMQRLHLGRLQIRSSSGANHELERVSKLVGFLCDADAGGAAAEVFIAILRWVYLRLGWIEEARAWSPGVKMRAAWIHASQLQAILAAGVPPNGLADWFAAQCREFDADRAGVATCFDDDVCHPRGLDPGGLLIRGIAFLFDEASEEIIVGSGVRQSLSKALNHKGRILAGSRSIWRPLGRQPNELGSFLAMPREHFLPRILDAASLKEHFDWDAATSFQNALEGLQRCPADAGLWRLVEFLGGPGNFEGAEKQYLNRALARVDFAGELESNPKLHELIMIVCQHAAAHGDLALKSNFRSQLYKLAGIAASRPRSVLGHAGGEIDEMNLGGALLDAAWILSVVPNNPAETASVFFDTVGRIVVNWPMLATYFRTSLTSLVAQLPIECQSAWIPLQLELRALG